MTTELFASLNQSIEMFLFLGVELTVLFLAISYFVGVLQDIIPPARIQHMLSSKNGKGYVVAALLGSITPFCSCSTIPFLKGLLRAKAGFGTMMVFLFASPLLNPIIIGLFIATFGVAVAAHYFAMALSVSVVAGYALEKLGFEQYVKQSAYQAQEENAVSGCLATATPTNKWRKIWTHTWVDFRKVFPYLLLGISIGSVIYGFMPTEIISQYAGKENIFAIPVAAIIGIPLYIRAEAVIPISAALVAKGMGIGAVMALIIGSAGASLTEVILLKSIFKNPMIATFLIVVLGMAMLSGYVLMLVN